MGGRSPEDGEGVAVGGLDHAEGGTGAEGGVRGEEVIEAAEVVELVVGAAPAQVGGVVDVDLLGGEPLDAASDTEGAFGRKQRREADAETRIGGRAGGEAQVVVGLGEMDERAYLVGERLGAGEVVLKGGAVLRLEDFGVGPVEAGGIEERAGDGNLAAETLQKEYRLGETGANAVDAVDPDILRDHVAGVAAEAVDAFLAPVLEDGGHELAETGAGVV